MYLPSASNQQKETFALPYITKLVETRSEIKEALHLVYQKYNAAGFQKKNRAKMRINFHNLLPNSHTLIHKNNGVIEGTLTLVQEYYGTLPSSELFATEIQQMHQKKSLICELSGFAMNTSSFKTSKRTLFSLFKSAFILGFDLLGCTDFCMMINPSHYNFYKNEMQFKTIGEVKHYKKVNGAPAILLKLNLTTCKELFLEKKPQLHNYFFIDNREKVKNQLRPQLRHHKTLYADGLAQHLLETENFILANLTAHEKEILHQYYPSL